jgi:hypothetical protein
MASPIMPKIGKRMENTGVGKNNEIPVRTTVIGNTTKSHPDSENFGFFSSIDIFAKGIKTTALSYPQQLPSDNERAGWNFGGIVLD